MKNIVFYLEYATNKDKRKATRKNLGNHTGNCIAVDRSTIRIDPSPFCKDDNINFDCFGAVYFQKDSDCCGSTCSQGYLTEKCKRVSEKTVLEIHPKLLQYLK